MAEDPEATGVTGALLAGVLDADVGVVEEDPLVSSASHAGSMSSLAATKGAHRGAALRVPAP
jgi:hypothetical protein